MKDLVRVKRRDFIAIAAIAAASAAFPSLAVAAAPAPQTILIVGDSLSAEYGLARGTGWVALLERRLADQKIAARVVNASISGDTTAGGRARLAPLLAQHKPAVVVIELGGNDALRGLPLKNTQENLTQMVEAAKAAGARVLVVGIQVPPNYGTDYTRRFSAIFEEVATQTRSAVVPFFLQGVADGPNAAAMFQPDRIHPLAAAQPLMLDNVWPEMRKLLR
ncbi:arylesterase [uncultured Xylophilus sp.]|uniref:arylesterase n=1 Tax=uncultured Xylophilus sp. TaxID=296832 RepID=UPI0025FDC2CC|nr:arylesterase [uncultured Xylophilus sp.]